VSSRRQNRSGNSYAVSSLAPIIAGGEAALRSHLRGLTTSPFAALPSVHFARWVVIDEMKLQWPGAPQRRTKLRSQYLLFSASVTAPDATSARDLPGSFFAEVATTIPEQADAVWRSCVSYPGADPVEGFVDYLERSLLDTLLFHVGYPDTTVHHVKKALAGRDGLAQFALTYQAVSDPEQLREDYLRESAAWDM